MWTDNETKTDLIGFRVHADLIRSVVTDEDLLPVVLGVFGDWGGGKSSIMRMLQDDFESGESDRPYEDIVCLYFNGWMFEGYEDAKTALLTSILVQLGEHKRFGSKVKDSVVGLLKRVKWMEGLKIGAKFGLKYGVPLGITALSGGTIPAYLAPLAGDFLSKTDESSGDDKLESDSPGVNWSKLIEEDKGNGDLLEVRKFRDDFEVMLAKTDIKSLVILIDDLDRCLPERIIETLEAIKLFVLVPKTAFVIGADPRIVRHAIGTRYAKQVGESEATRTEVEDLTKDYLEKLIQIPYHLPRLSPSEVETYINLLACQKFLNPDQNELVRKDWAEKRSSNFYSSYQVGAIRTALGDTELPVALQNQLAWSNAIAQVVTEGLKGNPRQVKRMLNALLLRKKLANVGNINMRDEVLAKLMVLEYSHLARFYELNDWQSREEGRPSTLRTLETAALGAGEDGTKEEEDIPSEWKTSSLQKWLQMEPSLKDVDLRDYFWLMRDRTSSTLAGVNMVSPLVRRLYTTITDGNDGEQEVAAKEAQSLEESDREALLGLLQQHLSRHPSEPTGYNALLKLADLNVSGAARLLLDTIKNGSADLIPAGIAMKLKILGQGDGTLKDEIARLLTHTFETSPQTAFGRAAKTALK